MTGTRLGWWCAGLGLLGIALAYAAAIIAPAITAPALLLAFAIPTATGGITLIAIGRRARRSLVGALVFVHAMVAIGLVLAAPGPFALTGTFGAVPHMTVVVLIAAGIVPLLLLPVLYALTFDDALSASVLARVRDAKRST